MSLKKSIMHDLTVLNETENPRKLDLIMGVRRARRAMGEDLFQLLLVRMLRTPEGFKRISFWGAFSTGKISLHEQITQADVNAFLGQLSEEINGDHDDSILVLLMREFSDIAPTFLGLGSLLYFCNRLVEYRHARFEVARVYGLDLSYLKFWYVQYFGEPGGWYALIERWRLVERGDKIAYTLKSEHSANMASAKARHLSDMASAAVRHSNDMASAEARALASSASEKITLAENARLSQECTTYKHTLCYMRKSLEHKLEDVDAELALMAKDQDQLELFQFMQIYRILELQQKSLLTPEEILTVKRFVENLRECNICKINYLTNNNQTTLEAFTASEDVTKEAGKELVTMVKNSLGEKSGVELEAAIDTAVGLAVGVDGDSKIENFGEMVKLATEIAGTESALLEVKSVEEALILQSAEGFPDPIAAAKEGFSDFATTWQVTFSDPATPQMEGIISFHNDLITFLVIILFVVVCMTYQVIFAGQYSQKHLAVKGFSSSALSPITDACVFFYNSSGRSFTNFSYLNGTNHHSKLEVAWTLAPAVVCLSIVVPSFGLLYCMEEIVEALSQLAVTGHQWFWEYECAQSGLTESASTINGSAQGLSYESYMAPFEDLVVGALRLLATDEPVYIPSCAHTQVTVTSADVLHSWAVPAFGVKTDACPGRLNHCSLYPRRIGHFFGQCSEICGAGHGFMPISVISAAFEDYLTISYKTLGLNPYFNGG